MRSAARTRPARYVVKAPAIVALATLVAALLWAPEIHQGADHERFSNLFGTTAQVIATLVVALAFEASALRREDTNLRRLIATVTLGYVALGGTAAVVALNPGLPESVYGPLFAVAMAGAVGALLSVLAIAYRAIRSTDD